MSRRVVVTGLGLVTPLGIDVDGVWTRMLAGTSGVKQPTRHGGPGTPPAGAVGEVDAAAMQTLTDRHPKVAALGDARTLFGVAASSAALAQAGLAPGDHPRAGVSIGSGPGVHRPEDVARWLGTDGQFDLEAYGRGHADVHPESLVRHAVEQPAALVARRFGLGGPLTAPTTACAAGNMAIGSAFRAIRSGRADWMVAGGADAMINPLGLVFFVLLGATRPGGGRDPATACRPFDRARMGLVMGEGAGCAVLEAEEHARARGAPILAELAGYGSTLDAYGATAPHPKGRGAAEAMRRALADAALDPADVDFVSAHGTGTKRNDPAEAEAIRTVFGSRVSQVAVSASKSMLGHLLSAAAGVAFVTTVLSVMRDIVPPTTNLKNPDPAVQDLDHVRDVGRAMRVRAALSNAFAFGGQNACVVVRKAREARS